ncbi:hypothetical protein VZC37_22890 [Gordonia sp. LSe1-13]|uniref:Uncharacterized protein n=1 Tax=Gordonia sesuvii TaxID=3116777 RepID=A0ABU7MJB3_9ACTN|nr:hypothetical protein [Gordonia sp. LSe1-13]
MTTTEIPDTPADLDFAEFWDPCPACACPTAPTTIIANSWNESVAVRYSCPCGRTFTRLWESRTRWLAMSP